MIYNNLIIASIGIIGSILLYLRNSKFDRQLSYFFITISLIQLLNTIILPKNDYKYNIIKIITNLQKFIQPLLIGYLFYNFYNIENKNNINLLQLLYLISLGLFLLSENNKFWKVYTIVSILSLFLINEQKFSYIYSSYFILVLLYNWYFNKNNNMIENWWYILAATTPYLKLINIYKLF